MCCHSDGRSATDAPDEHMLQHHVAVAVVSQDGDDFVVLSSSATLDSRVEHEMADARMYPRTTTEAAGSSSKALWVRHSLPEKVYLEYWDGGVLRTYSLQYRTLGGGVSRAVAIQRRWESQIISFHFYRSRLQRARTRWSMRQAVEASRPQTPSRVELERAEHADRDAPYAKRGDLQHAVRQPRPPLCLL